ncbi:transketolase [Sporosalibacterium faouarense]|uniref:transketolase n=1 Tax=Sporosalibacterium faouarense TaxID=516123 RepID=UPI00141C85D9|nr:transketolase [Sporosalibacterium faouarense]MTI49872.1 transketolase [Bacillota bacterium]
MKCNEIKELKKVALSVRRDCIEVQKLVGSGHLGGSFSVVELLTYLYFSRMDIDPKMPLKKNRDVLILSKGHASLAYYSILARRGFFPLDELKTYRKINSRLQGHTHIDEPPGVECSTGSLGQGLSYGIGVALGYKKANLDNKVYVILGDGEIQEGQIWEGIMLQGKLQMDNLITIIDNNKIQLDDTCENIMGYYNLKAVLQGFNHNVIEIDGNNFEEIHKAINQIQENKSNIIIANTVKGKGVSFMENVVAWHAKKLDDEEYNLSLNELDNREVHLDE